MKEATGELSTTVITVVAIGAILTLFTVFLLPSLRSAIRARTYCEAAADCKECINGKKDCHYYIEDGDSISVSSDTVKCDC